MIEKQVALTIYRRSKLIILNRNKVLAVKIFMIGTNTGFMWSGFPAFVPIFEDHTLKQCERV
jgi:hypothetical protein